MKPNSAESLIMPLFARVMQHFMPKPLCSKWIKNFQPIKKRNPSQTLDFLVDLQTLLI